MFSIWIDKLKRFQARQRPIDRWLLFLLLAINITGLIMLDSASSVVAYRNFQDGHYYFKLQLIWAIIGWSCFWIFSRINYKIWKRLAWPILFFAFFLLLSVFIPGLTKEVHNSTSWIKIFGVSFQPSELVKLLFVIYLAAWLANRRSHVRQSGPTGQLRPLLMVYGAVAGLILLQPDLGTLIIITASFFILLFVGGVRLIHLGAFFIIGLLALVAIISFNSHQQNRFHCLLDLGFSPQKYCYQVNQSLIAIGSGDWFGRGLGNSRQKYLNLPELHNDFIFAIMAEELGFVLSAIIIIAFFLLFYHCLKLSKKTNDDFAKFLIAGIVGWLAIQTMFNIGGVTNLLPMTGIPLPLISHGGTSLVSCLIALGIIANISRQTK